LSSIYLLKPKFQALLSPLVQLLYRAGCSANQVTVATLFACLLMAFALYYFNSAVLWLCLPVFMLVRMALNALDGMLAKRYKMQSALGFMLNEVADLLADAAFLLAFSTLLGFYSPWLISMLLLIWLTEFFALLALQTSGNRQNSGPLGKSDRAVFFAVFALLIGLQFDPQLLSFWFFSIGHLLLLATCGNRIRAGLIHKKES